MKPRPQYYRVEFRRRTRPPYICFFCLKEVKKLMGVLPESLSVHHIDGDPDNNDPENWAPAHKGCHASHHSSEYARIHRTTRD
jgi:hypothetical protein